MAPDPRWLPQAAFDDATATGSKSAGLKAGAGAHTSPDAIWEDLCKTLREL